MISESVDVVIAGGGPTGLLLAIELTLAGVRVTVLEPLHEPDTTIRAGAIGALAGEALERRGMAQAIEADERSSLEAMKKMMSDSGTKLPPWEKIGGHFAGLFLIDQTRQREPQRRLRGVRQLGLERMLGARAQALGIDVRRGGRLLDFSQDEAGVAVAADGPAGAFALRCAYLVGCDGGRSLVRKRAGFDFPGTEPTLTGHQAMVELDHPERLLPLGWRRTPVGMLAYGPIPGRVFTVEFDGPPADRDTPVTREEIEASLRRVSGADVRVMSMQSATRFTDHARQASSYRLGRVLLAGDAAHVHSPFGGQGLNLGLLDAANLGWKLAAVVRGRMPDTLLDSYEAERHPIAARVLANTRAQVALMRPDAHTSALRDIVAELMDIDEGNRYFGEMMSGLGSRYALDGDHPRVGTLSGDFAVNTEEGDTTLFALMQQGQGVLIDAGDGSATRIARDWQAQLRCARAVGGPSLLLRPDACIAWACDDESAAGLEAQLVRWFGAPRADAEARAA
jgi:2-polyprenyl-6-methoxyphenol hydroxylase-like FAD-dependent oxidoreductase